MAALQDGSSSATSQRRSDHVFSTPPQDLGCGQMLARKRKSGDYGDMFHLLSQNSAPRKAAFPDAAAAGLAAGSCTAVPSLSAESLTSEPSWVDRMVTDDDSPASVLPTQAAHDACRDQYPHAEKRRRVTPPVATPSSATSIAFAFPTASTAPPSCPNSAHTSEACRTLDCSCLTGSAPPPPTAHTTSTTPCHPSHASTRDASSAYAPSAAYIGFSAAMQQPLPGTVQFGSLQGLLRHSTWPQRRAEEPQAAVGNPLTDVSLPARRTASGSMDFGSYASCSQPAPTAFPASLPPSLATGYSGVVPTLVDGASVQLPLPLLSGRPIGLLKHSSIPAQQLRQAPLECPGAPTVPYNPSSWPHSSEPVQQPQQPRPASALAWGTSATLLGDAAMGSAFAPLGLGLSSSLVRAQSCMPAQQQQPQQRLGASAFSAFVRQQQPPLYRAASAPKPVYTNSTDPFQQSSFHLQQQQQSLEARVQQQQHRRQQTMPPSASATYPAAATHPYAAPQFMHQQAPQPTQQLATVPAAAVPSSNSTASAAPWYSLPMQVQAVVTAQLRAQGITSISPLALAQVLRSHLQQSSNAMSAAVAALPLQLALAKQQQQQQQQLLAAHPQLLSQYALQEQAAAQANRVWAAQVVRAASPRPAFPQLIERWASVLPLQRRETCHLTLHLWERLRGKVGAAEVQSLGAARPWEAALMGCLWIAAKMEECRRGLPSATKVGLVVGCDRRVVGAVELYLMQLLNWRPLAGYDGRAP